MHLREVLPGRWQTRDIRILGFHVFYIVAFASNGDLEITGKYRSRILQTVMALWQLRITGTWGIIDGQRLTVSIDGLSTYPTRLIDQALRSLRIQISADELISNLVGAACTLLGVNDGAVFVVIRDFDTIAIKGGALKRC